MYVPKMTKATIQAAAINASAQSFMVRETQAKQLDWESLIVVAHPAVLDDRVPI